MSVPNLLRPGAPTRHSRTPFSLSVACGQQLPPKDDKCCAAPAHNRPLDPRYLFLASSAAGVSPAKRSGRARQHRRSDPPPGVGVIVCGHRFGGGTPFVLLLSISAPTILVRGAGLRPSPQIASGRRPERLKSLGPSPGPGDFFYSSSTKRCGSSRHSFTRTRNVTASLPSTMRWS